jgi:serine/threonine protein kinase
MVGSSALSGTLLDARFLLGDQIGAGGMGTVFRARDTRTDEDVALKILSSRDQTALLRFEREALVLKELHHPGIVRYIAHGLSELGAPYLAMEWLDGEDVARRLARQPFSRIEAIELGLSVASALEAAHSRGIIHRGLIPRLSSTGKTKRWSAGNDVGSLATSCLHCD